MDIFVDAHWMPIPELVAEPGETYEVFDSRTIEGLPTNGMTDKQNRRVWSPFDEAGREVARHELAHVRWSPERYDLRRLKIPRYALLAVEDARINLGLRHCGIPLVFEEAMRDEVIRLARQSIDVAEVALFTLRAVASFGTNVAPSLLELAASESLPHFTLAHALVVETAERLERARGRQRAPVVPFDRAIKIARWLARQLEKSGHPIPKGDRFGISLGCCGGVKKRKGPRDRWPGGPGCGSGGDVPGGVRAGRLRIASVPLRRPYSPGVKATLRRRRPAAEGTELRYMHRFVADGSIFGRKSRKPACGGTVLIDASGSMSLSPEDIDRIIEHAPAATLVGTYSGTDHAGELRIVVKNGHRASARDLQPPGHGNIVDLPALEWLAKQPEPRVWVSDGGVTGCDDVSSDALKGQCRRICKSAGIRRVEDAEGAAKLLRRAS